MKKIVGLFGLVLLTTCAFGQSPTFMYSVYMNGFIKYVQWPAEENQGDFEITVLGESPVFAELKLMAEKKRAGGTRTIHVTKISSLTEYKKSHILYITPEWTTKFSDVASKTGEAPVLLVTDQAAGVNRGCVNFVNNKEGKLAFEINQEQMTKHKLRAASELMRLAIVN